MLLSEVKWMVLGFIVCISGLFGALGHKRTICALRGSSVTLPCSAEKTAEISWDAKTSNGSIFNLNELSANGNNAGYKITEDGNFTLTITEVRESDENLYCCRKTADQPCWNDAIQLQVADLQVKVSPTTDGPTVNLMCSTSCPLTENPAAFVWYKNGEFLYEDWSPWYHELVTSDEAVKYSCEVKDYVHVRAPEVSVDSVTANCFSVTYAKGRLCSRDLKSVDEPCSVTYAKDVHVQVMFLQNLVVLTCTTSCPVADPHTVFEWYCNRELFSNCNSQDITIIRSEMELFSCAVKSNEALHSDEICINAPYCRPLKYVSRRICALEGSSVNVSSVYSDPWPWLVKPWYKIIRNVEEESGAVLVEAAGRIELHTNGKNHSTLRINDLRRSDSAEYMLCLEEKCKRFDAPGVMLTVTGLRLTMIPSAEVTEGQKVTLTCSTSCPLAESITYIWFLNKQTVSMTVAPNKHLLLDPVSSQHAGNYSCAVNSSQFISSPEQALIVKARAKSVAIMNAVKLALFLLTLSVVFKLHLMMGKRKIVTAPAKQRENEQTEQEDSLYEGIMNTNSPSPREQREQHEDTV